MDGQKERVAALSYLYERPAAGRPQESAIYDLTTFATNGRGDEDALATILMDASLKGWIEPFSQDNLLTRPVDPIMGRQAFEVLLKREYRAEFIEMLQNIGYEEV